MTKASSRLKLRHGEGSDPDTRRTRVQDCCRAAARGPNPRVLAPAVSDSQLSVWADSSSFWLEKKKGSQGGHGS